MPDPQDTRPAFYKERSALVEISLNAHNTAIRNLLNAFDLVVACPMTKDLKTHRAARPLHAIVNILRAYSIAIHSHQPIQALATFNEALNHIHEDLELPR